MAVLDASSLAVLYQSVDPLRQLLILAQASDSFAARPADKQQHNL